MKKSKIKKCLKDAIKELYPHGFTNTANAVFQGTCKKLDALYTKKRP
jgi:hypothetical protein